MIKIMHISDIHIGITFKTASFKKEFALRRKQEIKETFFDAVKHANDNNFNYLIIAGDLFDTEVLKISEVKSIFDVLSNSSFEVLIITGNHDPLQTKSIWNMVHYGENIHVFNETISYKEFEQDNLRVYGHSWDRHYYDDSVFNQIPELDKTKTNILIAHGDAYAKKTRYLPINKDRLTELGFDYVALGHIHKSDFITDRIAYSGCLEPFDFSEVGDHGYIEVILEGHQIKTKFEPFSKRKFLVHTINVSSDDTLDTILNRVRSLDSKASRKENLYRIIFKGRRRYDVHLDQNELKELLQDEFIYIEFKNNTKPDFDLASIKKENAENIIGKFIEKFENLDQNDEVNKEAFELGLEYLLSSKEGTL